MHTGRILLVDDDPDHLLISSTILRAQGYNTAALPGCDDMAVLLDLIGDFRPDLILMDHDMKGFCGTDLTRMLKSHADFDAIPIIYFSGREDIVQIAETSGADGYLSKPFKSPDLVEMVGKYLPV